MPALVDSYHCCNFMYCANRLHPNCAPEITKLALPIGGERKKIQQLLTFLPVPPGSTLKHGDVMFERKMLSFSDFFW